MRPRSFALLSLLLAACNGADRPTATAASHSTEAPRNETAQHSSAPRSAPATASIGSTQAPPAVAGVKAPLQGLLSMGAYKFVASGGEPDNSLDTVRKKDGLLQGIVVVATWRSLEKSATSGLTENNEIDQGLAEVRKYNAEHPNAPLAVKLRVWAGPFAPDWVMEKSGGAVHTVHTNVNAVSKPWVIGRVWSDEYRSAWAHLQELLAAKYDSEPLIHEVAVTSCQMFTAEPFFIDTTEPALKPMREAGLTDAKYQACLDAIPSDYAPWKNTRFETPLNPFRKTDGKKVEHDVDFTLGWMDRCKKADPVRCVFDNHDLDSKEAGKDYATMFAAMKKSGAEVEFQTFKELPDDLDGTIRSGVDNGATSIELWQDYKGFPEMKDDDLRKYTKSLEANAKRR